MEYSAVVKDTAVKIFELMCDLEDKRIAYNSPHGTALLFEIIKKAIDAETARLTSIIENSCIDKLDSSAPKNVKYGSYDAEGKFIPPDGLPNIPALEAACSVFEQNSADISVFYETLYKIANYGRDMQFMREIAADCINGKEKHSLISKLQSHIDKYEIQEKTLSGANLPRAKIEAIQAVIDELNGEKPK